jgi:hypothetical protein
MTAVLGVEGLCPPLCSYVDLKNGNVSLLDVEIYHWTINELAQARKQQMKGKK